MPYNINHRLLLNNGVEKFVNERCKTFYSDYGKPIRSIGTVQDVSTRNQMDDKLLKNQYYLTKAQEIGKIGSWELDIQKNILKWTDENYKIFGVPLGTDMNYDLFLECVHPDDKDYVHEKWSAGLNNEPYDIEHRLIVNDKVKWVREKADIEFNTEGKPIMAIGFTQDITEGKQLEEELEEIFNLSPDMVAVCTTEGKFLKVNPNWEKVLGYTQKEILGLGWGKLVHPDDSEKTNQEVEKQLKGSNVVNFVNRYRCKNGSYKTLEWQATFAKEGIVHATARDITQRKQAEEELIKNELKFRTVADFTYGWEYWIDPEGNLIYISPSCKRITGYSADDFLQNSQLINDIIHPDDIEMMLNHKHKVSGTNIIDPLEFRIITKTGEKRWIGHICQAVYDSNKRNIGIRGSNKDITERKKAEDEILNQLLEKEIILKEVHHRIKNNFASMKSLLSLQSNSTTNPEVQSALQDAIGRVDSMQVLYEKLLLTEDYQVTSVQEYLSNLIYDIINLFSEDIDISVEKQIDDFQLDPKRLVPIGIIVNELLTNIMKYAFPGRDSGLIEVTVKENQGSVTLTIQDNGNGLPKGFDIDTQKGFGLRLVKMLSQQLDGSFTLEDNNGTRSTLEFNI